MKTREKLSRPMGVRLSASVSARLADQAAKQGIEESELARVAIEAEITRRELAQDMEQAARLRAAGIDLKALADYAIGRQLAERAQIGLHFNSKGAR